MLLHEVTWALFHRIDVIAYEAALQPLRSFHSRARSHPCGSGSLGQFRGGPDARRNAA